jgi:hypothetical protein
MNEGQGSVSYSTPPPAGGGGGGFPAIGARDGLTIEDDYVVLGNLATDSGDPAELLDNRRLQMQAFSFLWAMQEVDYGILFNDPNGGSPPNYIPANWLANGTGGQFFSAWTPSNYGAAYPPFGVANRWTSGYDSFPDVNLPVSARPNVVGFWWAYNTDYQSGRVNPLEPSFRYATETFFVIGANDSWEFHTPEITTTSGTIFRMDSNYIARQTGNGFREIMNEDITIYSIFYPVSTGQFYVHFEYDDGSDTTRLQVFSQLDAGVTAMSLGNWTDGSALFTYQSGELIIAISGSGAQIIVLQTTNRVVLESSNYNQSVSPTFLVGLLESDIPSGDAVLEISTAVTTLGSRPFPTLTTVQRLALPTGTNNLWAFDNTLGKLFFTFGGTWHEVTSV